MAKRACVRCGTDLSERASTCPRCGNSDPFAERTGMCVECLSEIPPTSTSCPNCGEPTPLRIKDADQGRRVWLRANSATIAPAQRMMMYLLEILGTDEKTIRSLELLRHAISKSYGLPSVPEASESAAIALDCPKTAALCYDRIWASSMRIPEQVRFWAGTKVELVTVLSTILPVLESANKLPKELTEPLAGMQEKTTQAAIELMDENELTSVSNEHLSRWHAEQIDRELKIGIVPVYSSVSARDAEYAAGSRDVIVTLLKNLEVVDEGQLAWDQVLEFRSDSESLSKFRRFAHWLDRDMVGKSYSFIEDEVAIRLEDYGWAIRKHGLSTTIGLISSTMDSKSLIAGAAAAVGGAAAGEPLIGMIGGSALLGGRVVLRIAKEALGVREARRGPHSEVAFVHEVGKRLG